MQIRHCARRALMLIVALVMAASATSPVAAAEATTGTFVGTVVDTAGNPVAGARVAAASPSGRYEATTDARGRFTMLGVTPDTYVVSVERSGYQATVRSGNLILPGQTATLTFQLESQLRSIGHVSTVTGAFNVGAPADTFTVRGPAALAHAPTSTGSGLGAYTEGTVQGAIANVPGIILDPFANAIVRGGKAGDTVFDYDSIPIPQGLIAEPGGNVVGAQLPTTGIASTTVTMAGYGSESDNALGGVVNEIPAVGTYPGRSTLELGEGIGAQFQYANVERLGATPDLRWRYAVAATSSSEYFPYGNGVTFLPSEAATYGLSLQSRAQYSVESNVHYRASDRDDISLLGLAGEAAYTQYGSPFRGETVGFLDGADANGNVVPYPGVANQNAPVTFSSGVRGTYDIIKAAWLHTGGSILSRVQLYQSQFGSTAAGPFWDENGFPDGSISLVANQGGRQTGLTYDGDGIFGRNHLRFGAEYRVTTSFLDQDVPTADEFITSKPTIDSYLAYVGDTWNATNRFDVTAAARLMSAHNKPSDGFAYDTAALDPHVGLAYRIGDVYAVRVNFDHNTVAPLPLEVDRFDSANVDASGNRAPFVALAPETANDVTYSIEGGGRTQFRLTYYRELEQNLIDVLPVNYRGVVSSGISPSAIGIPTNIGQLKDSGFELWLRNGGLTFDGNLQRAFSSSASQFAYNDLNAPAIAAGHLFPVGYQPNFTADVSYELQLDRHRIRVTPSLSYESGYPYGNGKMAWIFDPATGKPEQVPNDNYVNPGANYYFLENPNLPYSAATNPYIATMGTNEGNDPNTLFTMPQTLVNLHIEGDITPRLTVILDIANLFNEISPTAYQVNAYLIGPPGYKGGNPNYESAYGAVLGTGMPYTLGNGVPTNDGQTQSVPWTYGTAGYMPQSYPLGRTVQIRLRYRM
jgi:hypothetical protein